MVALTIDTSGLVDLTQADAADVQVPLNQLIGYINDVLNGVQAFDRTSYGAAEALTIASGAITPTKSHIVIDTEAAAALDDLTTINNGAAGRELFIRIANSGRKVRLQQSGNIRLPMTSSPQITNTQQVVWLLHDGTNWNGLIVPTGIALSHGATEAVTIASGIITASQTRLIVSPETGTIDDLTQINGGADGNVIVLQAASGTVITVREGSTIKFANGRDRILVGLEQTLTLMWYGTGGYWVEYAANTYPVMSHPRVKSSFRIRAVGNTFFTSLCNATQIGLGALSNANDAIGSFVQQAVAATTNTQAGEETSFFTMLQPRHNPEFFTRIKLGSDIATTRIFCGLWSARPTNAAALGAVTGIGFRYDTSVPDAGWLAVISDGTTTNTLAVANNSVAANGVYDLFFRVEGSTCFFSVNNGPETSFSTGLSTISSNNLGMANILTTLANAAKTFAISEMYCEF